MKTTRASLAAAAAALAATTGVVDAYKTWTVDVGNGGQLAFSPQSISDVPVGDVIEFRFHQKNHTASQSSFNEPCRPLLGDQGQPIGFDTGFTKFVSPGPENLDTLPTFSVTVNDTKPVWVYCAQLAPPPGTGKTHCQQGMVFAVNPPSTGNTFEKFVENAKNSTAQNSNMWSVSVGSGTTSTSSWSSSSSSTNTYAAITTTNNWGSGGKYYTQSYSGSAAAPSATNGYGGQGKMPMTHYITVGGTKDGQPILQFNPQYVHANVGDYIEFMFDAANHTATVSSFAEPCLHDPLRFDTGFMPFNSSTQYFMPKSGFIVTDDKPIWMFCRQPGKGAKTHCQSGMVFAVNPPSSGNTFASFLSNAQASTIQNTLSSSNSSSNKTLSSSEKSAANNLASSGGSLTETEAQDAKLDKIQSYGPILLGMVGGALALLVILVALVATLLRRSSSSKGIVGGRSDVKYAPVAFKDARSGGGLSSKLAEHEHESYEYETPSGRYTD